ncbi:MAG: hypothetical protein ACTFAK_11225 [Candidatus Electronema sp. VV]
MFDGLLDILKLFLTPLIEAIKTVFCWAVQFFFSLVSTFIGLIASIFPSYPVPAVLRSGFSNIESILDALNWVFPLGYAGGLMLITFYCFVSYFLFAPFYRAVMDLF